MLDISLCEKCGACSFQIMCDCPNSLHLGIPRLHSHAMCTFAEGTRELVKKPRHRLAVRASVPEASCSNRFSESPASSLFSAADTDLGDSSTEEFIDVEECGEVTGCSSTSAAPTEVLLSDHTKKYNRFHGKAGTAPRTQPILRYKDRTQTSTERRRLILKARDEAMAAQEIEAAKVWDTRLETLVCCFICGKREPSECTATISWYGCLNRRECGVWAHAQCTESTNSKCDICKAGMWRNENMGDFAENIVPSRCLSAPLINYQHSRKKALSEIVS
ncbi:hypothetical protein ANCCAN_13680 [Ancylostoma caninum]|uniref:Uncharacterized protein n=1 Tax=Ancylostoma caninum TaxID=29170 RepID=A0A368GAT5_ANCCA|nr:hypothetical protein ANCCAN_13680 [Ancylostoma caninum]